MKAVEDQAETGDGQLTMEANEGEGVFISFSNVPPELLRTVEEDYPSLRLAVVSANRTLIFVKRAGRGKKLTLSVAAWGGGSEGFPRGMVATPEKVAAYAAQIVTQASKLPLRLPRDVQLDRTATQWAEKIGAGRKRSKNPTADTGLASRLKF